MFKYVQREEKVGVGGQLKQKQLMMFLLMLVEILTRVFCPSMCWSCRMHARTRSLGCAGSGAGCDAVGSGL